MNCLSCAHLDMRTHPKHALVGIGQCKRHPLPGVFYNFSKERECEKFDAAEAEIVAARVEWNEKRAPGAALNCAVLAMGGK